MARRFRIWLGLAGVSFAVITAGCGGGILRATHGVPLPDSVELRHLALDAFGQRLHAALRDSTPLDLLFDVDEVRVLQEGTAATRSLARRASLAFPLAAAAGVRRSLHDTSYLGICVQDAHDESARGALGLMHESWTFRRVLLAARRLDGHRVALWLDGVFIFADTGFGILDLERIEDLRWEHSDLDILPCDMVVGL